MNKLLEDNVIVSLDSETITTWAASYIEIRDRMFSLSRTLTTMPNGLPYSIGVAAMHAARQVACVLRDGGLSTLLAEMATLAKTT